MRSDLPSGTVTFLFTDIEGSTKLLHELGPDEYVDPEGRLSAEYGLVGIPSTLVIDGRGRILYRFLGKIAAPLLTGHC